jgi:hypothetical protein
MVIDYLSASSFFITNCTKLPATSKSIKADEAHSTFTMALLSVGSYTQVTV